MYRRTSLILILLLFVSFCAPIGALQSHAVTKMPSFSLEDVVTGEAVKSESFSGKSLLVVFFATWCPPCIEEIPNLIKMQNEFGDEQFSVVGISVDQEKGVVQKLVSSKDINYPVMMADKEVTRDFDGVYGIPTSFLVNNNGNVVKRYSGYVPHSVLVRDLEKIIR
ncbi:MAG: TlpA disulfide reductase family protein [Desulfocapsaceae bacterium]